MTEIYTRKRPTSSSFFPHGSVKIVLNRLRNKKSANWILITAVICLFVLSKQKSRVASKPQKPAAAPVLAAPELPTLPVVELPEVLPKRIFTRQLNPRKVTTKKASTKKVPSQRTARIKKNIRRLKAKELAQLYQKVDQGLAESPQGAVVNVDPFESLANLDPGFSFAVAIPRENPVTLQEGVLAAADLSAYQASLAQYGEAPQLEELPHSKTSEASNAEVAATVSSEDSSDEAPLARQTELATESEVETSPEPEVVTERVTTQPQPQPAEPELVRPPQKTHSVAPLIAAPSELSSVVSQGKKVLKSIQNTLAPEKKEAAPAVTTQKKSSNRYLVPGVEPTPTRSTEPVGKLYGKLSYDRDLHHWLETEKGHVELRLQKARSLDPADMIFVEYQFPNRDFSWDGSQVAGEYQLIASIFKASSQEAVAQVVYPQPLNAQSAKQMVVFHLRKRQVMEAIRSAQLQVQAGVVLSGTVFEANTADHQDLKTIPGAEIAVNGFPEWGTFKTNSQGSFRIPQAAAHSEFVLTVSAPEYYPTQVTIPVFQTTGYVSVHLVPKKIVNTITTHFTQRPQTEEKALVWGRLFNANSRAPESNQEIFLSGRRGRALYFGLLPDKNLNATTSTGSFAYFNVEPAFRSLGKRDSTAFDLIQALPGYAYYVELGRTGQHTLKGVVQDPYRQQPVPGQVKVVGSPLSVETDEHGRFEISGIELSPGILTLEIAAEGYPTSWHTLPWSAQERMQVHTFYLPESELVEAARTSVARTLEAPQTGVLLGGADQGFFGDRKQCVYVSLETIQGERVGEEQGPYPLNRADVNPRKPLCLSKYRPGFSYFNLKPNQYVLKWHSAQGELLRTHVTRVGADRVSILVN